MGEECFEKPALDLIAGPKAVSLLLPCMTPSRRVLSHDSMLWPGELVSSATNESESFLKHETLESK